MTSNRYAKPVSATATVRSSQQGSEPSRLGNRALNRATVVLWRSRGVVQLELGDRRIIVENVDPAEMTALLSRSEQRSETVLDSATAGRLRELAAILESAGFLTATQPGPTAEPPVAARLHPDLGAMSAQFGDAARP
jgi:hypothetical protein